MRASVLGLHGGEVHMIEIAAGLLVAGVILGVRCVRVTRRRRWMGRHPAPTFVFADLVGYTALTEIRGDEAAARLAREFRRTMASLSREHGAWQVKSMGDGVMIWAPDAVQAVALASRTVKEVGTRPDLLPVRVGAHTGPAVMCGWDWYGSAVNVAARLATEAEPNEALISNVTRLAACVDLASSLTIRSELALRGVARPIEVCRLAEPVLEGDTSSETLTGW
jgi:adenylate cyclase